MAQEFVLDASVTLSWAFREELNRHAQAVLEQLKQGQARVPTLWFLEVANALLVAERRGNVEPADSERFLALLQELPISMEPILPERAVGEILLLARAQQLSVYDAVYLDLALRDKALRAAASRVGVKIFGPSEEE